MGARARAGADWAPGALLQEKRMGRGGGRGRAEWPEGRPGGEGRKDGAEGAGLKIRKAGLTHDAPGAEQLQEKLGRKGGPEERAGSEGRKGRAEGRAGTEGRK